MNRYGSFVAASVLRPRTVERLKKPRAHSAAHARDAGQSLPFCRTAAAEALTRDKAKAVAAAATADFSGETGKELK
jgi:hypothetical protein